MSDLIRALMQATGEDLDDGPLKGPSSKPSISSLGQVTRLRELAPRFMETKVRFKPGDLVTPRPDTPMVALHGRPALVIETLDDESRNWDDRVPGMRSSLRPNMVILVFEGGYIVPVIGDAAFFELYTGEGSDL